MKSSGLKFRKFLLVYHYIILSPASEKVLKGFVRIKWIREKGNPWIHPPPHTNLVILSLFPSLSLLKACLSWVIPRNRPIGSTLDPVYMRMKKNIPVVYSVDSLGLSSIILYSTIFIHKFTKVNKNGFHNCVHFSTR